MQPGLFGKLPAHGDFINRGLPAPLRKSLDHWITRHIGQQPLPAGALRVRLTLGGAPYFAVIMASRDKHGRGFPSCNEANGGAGMNLGISHYDPCPEGLSAAPAGEYVLAKGAKDFYRGIGEGDGIDCNRWSDVMCVLPAKVCVGPRVGQSSIRISQGYEGDYWYKPATVYESVRLQSPRSNVLYVDVFINGELYRRARW